MTAMARLLFLGLFFWSASVGYAQTVRLSGKITNQKNEPIPGASVIIEGTSTGSPANAEGRFVLNLEVGKKYTLVVSATGYTTKAVSDVEASATLENNLDIVLEESKKNELGGVVVRTTRRQESTNALLAFQKNNTAVSSGIAADFIRRTPDKNTGEVLRRVSGTSIQDNKFVVIRGLSDRYNSAFINGAQLPSSEPDKKAFSFDVIPSQLIDNIIINKTATPDLTGEFAGGLVQVVTKDIPSSSQLIFNVGLGFNTASTGRDFVSNERGPNDWLGFSDRKLSGAYPKSYGAYNQLSVNDKVEISKSFRDDVYREVQSTAGPIQQYGLTWANVIKGKKNSSFGSVIGLTYRNSKTLAQGEGTTRFLSGYFDYQDAPNKYTVNWGAVANFAWTKGKHKIALKNLFNQLMDDNYYSRTGSNPDNLQDVILRSSILNQRSLYSTQLEGTHTFFKREIKFNWNVNYSYNNKQVPDLRVQTYARPIGTNDPFTVNLRGNNTNRFFSDLKDNAFGYNASLSFPFTMGAHKQTLKVGGAATVRLRDFRATILGIREPNDQSLLALPYDQVFNHGNFSPTGFYFTTDLQNPSDKYYGVSALSAGYVMFDNKLNDKFRLVWGSRFENFEQFLKSNVSSSDKASIIDSDKFDVLPSANLTFSPNNKTNFRFAASRTVARPEFREIASFAFFDFETVASTAGTDSLKRSSIINGDIRWEYYPKPGEVLSLGAFYKNFTDPIELRLNEASTGSRRQYEFQNAEKATLYGVEAEFRKSLSFLGVKEWLSNLYFNGNVSLIFSEVTLGNLDASGNKLPGTDRPLQGQSPYLINAGFTYDGASGTNVSLLYNRIGSRLALVGNTQFPDIYEKSRDLVDFQISQKIFKKKGEVRLTVGDILNQQIATYQNKDDKPGFKEGTDAIFSSFKQGTTFTLGFIYNLDLKK